MDASVCHCDSTPQAKRRTRRRKENAPPQAHRPTTKQVRTKSNHRDDRDLLHVIQFISVQFNSANFCNFHYKRMKKEIHVQ